MAAPNPYQYAAVTAMGPWETPFATASGVGYGNGGIGGVPGQTLQEQMYNQYMQQIRQMDEMPRLVPWPNFNEPDRLPTGPPKPVTTVPLKELVDELETVGADRIRKFM